MCFPAVVYLPRNTGCVSQVCVAVTAIYSFGILRHAEFRKAVAFYHS